MEFTLELNADLPKLSWISICLKKYDKVYVHYGPCVEAQEKFCIAGIWDGEYLKGNFDQTDIVAGTGIRFRENRVIFVTPGNTIDRIVYYESDKYIYVSNSFTAILAIADLALIEGYNYEETLETIIQGIYKYKKEIPTQQGDIKLTHYNNLEYNGNELKEVKKINSAPHFSTFDSYHKFLLNTAERVSTNANAPQRKNSMPIISTISSGYDSALATVIAKHMGAEKAVTITQANSWLNRLDSGEKVAAALGMKCECYNIKKGNCPNEETLWAAIGDGGDINMTIFKFPEPICLMITAFHGDYIWEKEHYDISEFLIRHDTSAAGLTEFALHRGVINCSIAFWAIQNAHEIQKIWRLDEMKPWTLNTQYDRPIPRRIVEQEGVPREIFALKKTTSGIGNWSPNPLPFSKDLRKDYKAYLKSKGFKTPFRYEGLIWQLIIAVDCHILEPIRNLLKSKKFPRLPFHRPRIKRWRLFIWANEKVKLKYKAGIKRVQQKNVSH